MPGLVIGIARNGDRLARITQSQAERLRQHVFSRNNTPKFGDWMTKELAEYDAEFKRAVAHSINPVEVISELLVRKHFTTSHGPLVDTAISRILVSFVGKWKQLRSEANIVAA